MTHSTFPLRIPDDLKAAAAEQAEAMGVSLNQYVGMSLAARVGAQAEAARFFSARGSRGSTEAALAALGRIGRPESVRDDDRLDTPSA
jgi:hypothetical protein